MTPASVLKRLKANRASLVSDFHRASPKMAWLRLRRIAIKSTETENCYQSLNRDLHWLWNSVYYHSSTSVIRNFKPLAIVCGCTACFVSDLVGNPEDMFSHNAAHILAADLCLCLKHMQKAGCLV